MQVYVIAAASYVAACMHSFVCKAAAAKRTSCNVLYISRGISPLLVVPEATTNGVKWCILARQSRSRAEETEVRIYHGRGGVFSEATRSFLSLKPGENFANGMSLRRQEGKSLAPCLSPGEGLPQASHTHLGSCSRDVRIQSGGSSLLYISGGISPWTNLLFPEATQYDLQINGWNRACRGARAL